MYGMVNAAVRGMVLESFGEEKWRLIHQKAGAPESFVPMDAYDDAITYGLVAAAEQILDVSAENVLKGFGQYWVMKIATLKYADLMEKSGTDFVDFVKNLDHMHQRIRVTFPDYRPPSFRVKTVDEQTFQLDYYSERQGLLPFVEGLLGGLAQHFEVTINIEHVPDDDHPLPCKRMTVSHAPAPNAQ